MSLFDLRLVDPRTPGAYSEYLDGWSNLNGSTDRKAPGALTFTVGRDQPNRELMASYQLVAFLQDGVEAENCRYLIRGDDGNDMDEVQPDVSYTCASVWDAFKDVEIYNPGSNAQITWTNTTVGQILYTAVNAVDVFGWLDWWGFDGMTFTAAADTLGNAWAPIESLQLDDGSTIFDLMDWLIQHHYVEISTSGGRLNAYVPDTRGLDLLTTPARPVILMEGYDLEDAPRQRSWDNVATSVVVVGGETKSTTDQDVTLPRVKVKVYSVDAPVLTQDFALPVGYGNFYGGYSLHDKDRKVNGDDWAKRIPEQIDAILQSGAWMWGAIELHEETADDLPEGGHRYFLSEMQERDPDWELFEGKGGNHLLYRPSRIAPISTMNMQMPGSRWATEYQVMEPVSGFRFHGVVGHLRANDKDGKSRDKERDAEAHFLGKRIAGWQLPGILMADINDRTHRQGNAREIIESYGLLGLRDREPGLPYAKKNSLKPGYDGVWIEDIWTQKTQQVTGSAGILTNGSSDHDLYFRTTVTFKAGVAQERGAYGVRQKRISVDGVQSPATLTAIGKQWIALHDQPQVSRTYKTSVVDVPSPPVFRSPATGTRPAAVVKPWATLVPGNRSLPVQGLAKGRRYTFTTQTFSTSTIVTRWDIVTTSYGFDLVPKEAGRMTVPTQAADELKVETIVADPANKNLDTDWLIFPLGVTGLASTSARTWVRVPFSPDKTYTTSQLVPFQMRQPPNRDPLARDPWIQGETGPMQDYYWRVNGTPRGPSGASSVTPDVPQILQTIRNGQVLDTVSLSSLGFDAGAPVGGRVELAGLTTTRIDGWPHLLIGVQTGTSGSYAQRVYSYPILVSELGPVYVDRGRAQLVPSVDYRVGDTIGISLANGEQTSPERIMVISASCDDDTSGTYLITTGDWFDERDVAVDRLLAKYEKS